MQYACDNCTALFYSALFSTGRSHAFFFFLNHKPAPNIVATSKIEPHKISLLLMLSIETPVVVAINGIRKGRQHKPQPTIAATVRGKNEASFFMEFSCCKREVNAKR